MPTRRQESEGRMNLLQAKFDRLENKVDRLMEMLIEKHAEETELDRYRKQVNPGVPGTPSPSPFEPDPNKQLTPGEIYKEWERMHPKNPLGESTCLHDNCPGCKSGTCNGMHMLACNCPKCSPYSSTTRPPEGAGTGGAIGTFSSGSPINGSWYEDNNSLF